MKRLLPFLILTLVLSCTDDLPNLAGRTVTILSPADNTVLSDTLVEFSWEAVPNANRYRLLISDVNEVHILDTVIHSVSFKKRLHRGAYLWQIQAVNAVSVTSSAVYTLALDPDFSPDANWNEYITLLAPLDSTTYMPDSLGEFIIWWELVDDAHFYQIQMVTPNFINPQKIILEGNTYGPTFAMSLDSGTYQWRIRAYKENHTYGEYGQVTNVEQLYTPYTEPRTLFIRP